MLTARDSRGNSALHLAAMGNHSDAALFLVSYYSSSPNCFWSLTKCSWWKRLRHASNFLCGLRTSNAICKTCTLVPSDQAIVLGGIILATCRWKRAPSLRSSISSSSRHGTRHSRVVTEASRAFSPSPKVEKQQPNRIKLSLSYVATTVTTSFWTWSFWRFKIILLRFLPASKAKNRRSIAIPSSSSSSQTAALEGQSSSGWGSPLSIYLEIQPRSWDYVVRLCGERKAFFRMIII